MKKKLSLKLAAGLVCAAMLAGCGSGSSGTEPQTIGESTQAAEESAAETAAAEPAEAQELTFVLNNEPDSLDPSYTNNSFASPFLTNLFEGLVTYDENGELAPGNAESWESNDDSVDLPPERRAEMERRHSSDGEGLRVFRPSCDDAHHHISVCEHDDGLHRERPGGL